MGVNTIKYKQTELGLIPNDWQLLQFVDVIDGFSSGQTPYRVHKEFYKGNIPWITSGELNYNIITDTIEKITPEGVKDANLKTIPVGTFLMAITGLEAAGTRGSCAITGVEATTNQSCMALYPIKNKLTTEYLYHFYVHYGNELAFKYCQGTKQQSYTGAIAKTLPIVLPPSIQEQTAIANALSEMDALIDGLEELIVKKKNLKQGALQKLLMPKEGWVKRKLGDICEINMGQSPSSSSYNVIGDGLPLIQGNADIKNRKQIIRNYSTEFAKICYVGDIIMTVRAPVGAIGKAIQKSCIGRGVCTFNDIKVSKEFLYHTLIFRENLWNVLEQGSTFSSANANQIKLLEIDIPKSKDDQEIIADVLSTMDNELELLEIKLSKAKQLKQGMMQNLLTGKIRLVKTIKINK